MIVVVLYMMSHTMLHPPESSNVLLSLKYSEVLVAQTSKKCGTADGGRTTPNKSNLDRQKERGEKMREKGEKKKRKSRRGRKMRRREADKLSRETCTYNLCILWYHSSLVVHQEEGEKGPVSEESSCF